MPDHQKSLNRRIDKLTLRLEKLETLMTAAHKADAPAAQQDGQTAQKRRPPPTGAPQLYCGLPDVPLRKLEKTVLAHHQRLVRDIEKKWVNGTPLHFCFFRDGPYAGPAHQMEHVRNGFDIWADVGVGVTFEEVDEIEAAEIRIGFLEGDGAWSYLGRDSIDIPGQHERTMNFGWDMDDDRRGVDVAVHEIGHALGFPHEHQNPFSGIVWNEEAVYDYFSGSPNFWSREDTFHNVLRKLPAPTVEGSDWDPDSIMHYGFGPGLILEPAAYRNGLEPALGLSEADKEEVRRFYPPIADTPQQRLERFKSELLSLEPAEQADFLIEPDTSREYTIQTFGAADVVMVLFEARNGDQVYVDGDDDSGQDANARITQWLEKGKRYVLRIRMYLAHASGDCAVMYW